MIRFRVSGYSINSCSVLFWGDEKKTFIKSSVGDKVTEIKVSAYFLFQGMMRNQNEEYNNIERI